MKLTDSKDPAVNPGHYQTPEGIESIDVIDDAITRAIEEGVFKDANGAAQGDMFNVIKYLLRYKEKNGAQDLEKAIWYAQDLRKLNHPHYGTFNSIEAFAKKIDDEQERMLFINAIGTALTDMHTCQKSSFDGGSAYYYSINVENAIKRLLNYIRQRDAKMISADAVFGPDPKYTILSEYYDPGKTNVSNFLFLNAEGQKITATYRHSEGILGETSGSICTFDTETGLWHKLYPGNENMVDRFSEIINILEGGSKDEV